MQPRVDTHRLTFVLLAWLGGPSSVCGHIRADSAVFGRSAAIP